MGGSLSHRCRRRTTPVVESVGGVLRPERPSRLSQAHFPFHRFVLVAAGHSSIMAPGAVGHACLAFFNAPFPVSSSAAIGEQ